MSKSRGEGNKKPAKAELFANFYHWMTGSAGSGIRDIFPMQFHVAEPAPGERLILLEKDDSICAASNRKQVGQAILAATQRLGGVYTWDWKTCLECADYWINLCPTIPMPKPVLWKSEEGLGFSRLPFDPMIDETGDKTKEWNALLSRMTNREAFIAWIGSLFFDKSDRQQYFWCFGPGGDSKGAIARFLHKVFGSAYESKSVPKAGDRFWSSTLINKRLVVFPDCNEYNFPSGTLFKMLTGDDAIPMERKGEQGFTARINSKFIFMSNERPGLSSEPADMRRVIYCELGKFAGEVDPGYEERLWAEGGYFLGACMEAYRQACPNFGPVKTDATQISDWTSVVEEPIETIVEEHFKIVPVHAVGDLSAADSCPASEMQRILRLYFKSKSDQINFINFLYRRHGVMKKVVRMKDGRLEKRYVGIRPLAAFEQKANDDSDRRNVYI